MREMPYDPIYNVRNRSNRGRSAYNRMDDMYSRRGGGNSTRNMRDLSDRTRNRIGYRAYDTYDTYGADHDYDRERRGYDDEERRLLMRMLGADGGYNEHFNKQNAKEVVEEMYHVKDNKKYIGEKYDMRKAHEVCEKYKNKLDDEVEIADVYVAINAQYHDYCELFEQWFGKDNIDDMIIEAAICFWFDDVDFGEDKVWKYFNELS